MYLFPVDPGDSAAVWRDDDHSDRRRGHAHGDFAAEFLRRTFRCCDGVCAQQQALIVAGALDGASGLILSVNMSKAMNRSFSNVLFGAFGQEQVAAAGRGKKSALCAAPRRKRLPEFLPAANKVVIVPGYGMAVAQAQHKVRELYDILTKTRHRREIRDSSGGRAHARTHERAAGRSRHSL